MEPSVIRSVCSTALPQRESPELSIRTDKNNGHTKMENKIQRIKSAMNTGGKQEGFFFLALVGSLL